MIMEKMKWPIIMSFIGIIVGLFIFILIANTSQMNKTERDIHQSKTNGLAVPICIVCAFIGLFVGFYLNEEESNIKKHGIDNVQTYEQKEGRGWILETKWNNPNTNNENVIITKKPSNDYLKSYFNGQLILDHGLNTAAKKIVYQCHYEARNNVWNKIKSGELSQL